MQVQFYGMFYKKGKKEEKKGISIEYLRYGRDETLGRVSNFLFSGFCALGESKRLSLFWIVVGRYMLQLRQVGR